MDRATQWETLRPLIATGFIIWGMALSLLVLGFMAFRLLIKDKVKPSAAPVRQPTGEPAGGEALYAPLKKHLHARYRLHWRRKVRLLLVTGDEAAIEQLVPRPASAALAGGPAYRSDLRRQSALRARQ